MLGIGLKNTFNHLSFDPKIQDSGKIQNGIQKRRKNIFQSNGQFSNRLNRFLSKKSTFTKSPISLPMQHFAKRYSLKAEILSTYTLYHLFLFVDFLQSGGDIQDGIWCKFSVHIFLGITF
jgi:hypothetical protein